MKDYLMKMKSICDTLAACGRPVSEEDQVLSILAGLGSEYEPTVAVLTSRIESYNVQTASALLLASENRALQQLATPEPSMSTNLAFYPKKNWQNNPGQQTTSRNNRGSYENFNNSGRDRGRNRTFHNKVVYQLCGKSGHTVQKCYHRFDISFSRLNNISNTPGQSLNASNSSSNVSSSNMTAMVATQPEITSQMILDSSQSILSIMVQAEFIWAMVLVYLSLTLVILLFLPILESYILKIFSMSLLSLKISSLYLNSVLTMLFSLNFTPIHVLSRIEKPRKFFLKE